MRHFSDMKLGHWKITPIIKHNYNDGDKISADFHIDDWLQNRGSLVTQKHIPCGYWPGGGGGGGGGPEGPLPPPDVGDLYIVSADTDRLLYKIDPVTLTITDTLVVDLQSTSDAYAMCKGKTGTLLIGTIGSWQSIIQEVSLSPFANTTNFLLSDSAEGLELTSVTDTINGFSYFYASYGENPGDLASIVQVKHSDLSVVIWSLSPYDMLDGDRDIICIDNSATYLYTSGSGPANEVGVLKLDLSTGLIVDSLDLASLCNANNIVSGILFGSTLYVGINMNTSIPPQVVKIDLTTFTVVATLSVGLANDDPFSLNINTEGTILYAGVCPVAIEGMTVYVVDLSTFVIINVSSTFPVEFREVVPGILFNGSLFYLAYLNNTLAKIDVSTLTNIDILNIPVGGLVGSCLTLS